MEFMDHLYQFGQFGILTFRDGIQGVGGLFLLVFGMGHDSYYFARGHRKVNIFYAAM